jgi:hypothetical protein
MPVEVGKCLWKAGVVVMKRLLSFLLITLLGSLSFLAACSEPTREDYRDMAAEEVCDEAERCDNLDDGSYEDCILENEARFNDLWPASDCDDGRIDEDSFQSCMNRARTAACEDNIFDQGLAWSECRASQVCDAEPDNQEENQDD